MRANNSIRSDAEMQPQPAFGRIAAPSRTRRDVVALVLGQALRILRPAGRK